MLEIFFKEDVKEEELLEILDWFGLLEDEDFDNDFVGSLNDFIVEDDDLDEFSEGEVVVQVMKMVEVKVEVKVRKEVRWVEKKIMKVFKKGKEKSKLSKGKSKVELVNLSQLWIFCFEVGRNKEVCWRYMYYFCDNWEDLVKVI